MSQGDYMAVLEDVVSEVRPLRKKGWSEKGIAKYTGLPIDDVRRALRIIEGSVFAVDAAPPPETPPRRVQYQRGRFVDRRTLRDDE